MINQGCIGALDYEKFTPKEKDILDKLKNFFAVDKKNIDVMLKIINGDSNISIRILDWFVSNYSKKNDIYYEIENKPFYVYMEYLNKTNLYSKKYFDPFCRVKKLIYNYRYVDENDKEENITFETSIGQLNFFHWAIEFEVIQYVELHLCEIEKDMKDIYERNKLRKISELNLYNISAQKALIVNN